MAKTNPIDSISINNVKYDFDPTELSSLTVTGNLTVNGTTATFNNITADTANLSVIKCKGGLTVSNTLSTHRIYLFDNSEYDSFFTTMSYDQDSQIFSIYVQGDGDESTVDIDATNNIITLSHISQIKKQISSSSTYTYSLPNKSGTIALTSDIKSYGQTAAGSVAGPTISSGVHFYSFNTSSPYYSIFAMDPGDIIYFYPPSSSEAHAVGIMCPLLGSDRTLIIISDRNFTAGYRRIYSH